MNSGSNDFWKPYAEPAIIQLRADVLAKIRSFMNDRGILEVETPILSHATVTDPHIESFVTTYHSPRQPESKQLYLQTSPEYAMKRLLSTGVGDIYQIAKVFRNTEHGDLHNPEFTMLEWYRQGYNHHQLAVELDILLDLFEINPSQKIDYGELFAACTGLDPHHCGNTELLKAARQYGPSSVIEDRSTLLDFIFSHKITPTLGHDQPGLVYHYPECQSALAQLTDGSTKMAERFELFINGMEIANGFHELTDKDEQSRRFEQDIQYRRRNNYSIPPIDPLFLNALQSGLPDCAGVAVGIDRLLMVIVGVREIQEVLAFPVSRA